MTDRDVMRQALEVLESLQGGCTDHDDGTVEAITVWCPEVIDALRAQLEQPELPEDAAMVAWVEKGEKIFAQAGIGFMLGCWWTDRPWRET